MPRGFHRLVGLVTLVWIWSRPALLLPGLLAVPSSGCLCDCGGEFNEVRVSSATPMPTLEVSGDGCGAAACDWAPPETGGVCREYVVKVRKAGSCHLTATATDGRQAATDLTVTLLRTDCCGNMYTTKRSDDNGAADTVILTFSGAGADGGAGRD